MVEQWLECAVIVEGNPAAASLLMERGLNSRDEDVINAINVAKRSSEELRNLYKKMRANFGKLSQRCHPLRTAFDLIRKKEAREQLFPGGIVSEETFEKDTLALADMGVNSLIILSRHFQTLPPNWRKTFKEARNDLSKERRQRQYQI